MLLAFAKRLQARIAAYRFYVPLLESLMRLRGHLLYCMPTDMNSARTPAFWIVDFSYRDTKGHHHPLNRLVVEAAGAVGFDTTILASRYLRKELHAPGIIPIFREYVYTDLQSVAEYRACAQKAYVTTCEDFFTAPLRVLRRPGTVLLIHTTKAWHLSAILHWVAVCRADCMVNVFLMFPPDADVAPALVGEQANDYRMAWAFARKNRLRVRFLAENKLLQQAYRAIGLADIEHRSIPSRVDFIPMPRPRADTVRKRPVLLFIGEARVGKGFGMVLAAMSILAARQAPIQFRLRLTSVSDEHLGVLRNFDPCFLDITTSNFFAEEIYFSELIQADAVLLPYDPVEYRVKNSNIVSESLCCGTPVIVPCGANSLNRFVSDLDLPCSVGMADYSAAGLVDAIQDFMGRSDEVKRAAQSASTMLLADRDPRRFIDAMVSEF